MKEEQRDLNQGHEQEDEIKLIDYWRVLLKRKKLIGLIVAVSVIVTALTSLIMPSIYQSKAVISPLGGKDSTSSSAAALILAQQFGISQPSPTQGAEIFNLLNSNVLRSKIIEKYQLLPVLFQGDWDPEKKVWKGKERNTWDGLRELKDIVKVSQNLKENTITVSVEYSDPEMAAKMTGYILEMLVDHMTSEARRVAKTNKDYLEDQVTKNPDPFIKQKIYFLIAQQIETMMMAEVKENFAFKVLDPPMVPDKRIRPKRTIMVVLAFVGSLILGIFTAFFAEYIERVKSRSAGGQRVC